MKRIVPLFAFVLFILPAPTHASDGVIEINQVCAVNTGCVPGDTPGFPVRIDASGSYVLTSNLTAPPSTSAIIEGGGTEFVTLDLNGFTIQGSGSGNSAGILLGAFGRWEIRNGTVAGFPADGIFDPQLERGHRIINVRVIGNAIGVRLLGEGAHVENCYAESLSTNIILGGDAYVAGNTVLGVLQTAGGNAGGISSGNRSVVLNNAVIGNTGPGISAGSDSTILGNTIYGNGTYGLSALTGSGYGSNVINDNTSGTVLGSAVQIGTNVCNNNTTCP